MFDKKLVLFLPVFYFFMQAHAQRTVILFNKNWKFLLGNDSTAQAMDYNDKSWRVLNLPHDWSIEGAFSKEHPTTFNQGALPAGVGWYRKTFTLQQTTKGKRVYINFDGVYRNSEVWINGHYLGKRPYGYSSFRYELTSYLRPSNSENIIAVKVDNSAQPSSRWYTGSGIYRKVWLETTNDVAVDHWSYFVTTPGITNQQAKISIQYRIDNAAGKQQTVRLVHQVFDSKGRIVATGIERSKQTGTNGVATVTVKQPKLWSVESPNLYKAVTKVILNGKTVDEQSTQLGIRSFYFDAAKGFFLNNKPLKILGVCNHHDLGALGAAFNTRAAERQLQMLKEMGCNAIRTAHNPPAPELLDLCDRMGFIVMDEAFDMWKKRKNRFDYNVEFNEWHKQDLEDMVRRDRNHPSVFFWSIGNEIREQFDSTGTTITKELVSIVKNLDSTRPVTSALTENHPEKNFIYQSKALDVLGFNYKHADYDSLLVRFPGIGLLATETASALSTRDYYEQPSDSLRIWPPDSKSTKHGNADQTVSAYDNTFAYWGATHEESWKAVKKRPFMAGLFVWSGFDFLGEPVPYQWPSRSSYYGIIDLAGFPKDVYYMYQSEWSSKPVLHVFPHWNWQAGQLVDVWAYYNNADEVELFLNGKSLSTKRKTADSIHVLWRVPFAAGTLKAVSRKNGNIVLTKEIKTAGKPDHLQLVADRKIITADGEDLSFITIKVVDKEGTVVPDAGNGIQFSIKGPATIAGVDNGDPVSHRSLKSNKVNAFHGLCLVLIQSTSKRGSITIEAESQGLPPSSIHIRTQ